MEAKVVKVISASKVAINKGTSSKIEEDDYFLIYELDPDDIIDPETGKNLGKLEISKGHARVIHVQEELSTLECVNAEDIPTKSFFISTFRGRDKTPSRFDGVKVGDFARRINL